MLTGNWGGNRRVINIECGYNRQFYKFSKKILKETLTMSECCGMHIIPPKKL